jgi:hypothetical protein
MPNWMQRLFEEWQVIKAAPYSALVVLAVLLTVLVPAIWAVMAWSYSTVLSNKNSQIDLLKDRITAYESKLKVASPDQAASEMQSIRDQLADAKRQLAGILNPPRAENGLYQRGRQIGVALPPKIDTASKTAVFSVITVAGGPLDEATNVEYRNLVLAYQRSDQVHQMSHGLTGQTSYAGATFQIVGNRAD